MNKFLIIVEETETGYSAYSPDLIGCIATGSNIKETELNMKEAIEFHIEGLKLEGYEIPKSTTASIDYYEFA